MGLRDFGQQVLGFWDFGGLGFWGLAVQGFGFLVFWGVFGGFGRLWGGGGCNLLVKRNDEISLKDLCDASDAPEWDAIPKTKAAKVLQGRPPRR